MSSPERFIPALREVDKGLGLPIHGRLQILREIESDLHELTQRYVNQGLSLAEARQRALEALVPDSQTMRELDRLHEPLYRRLTGALTPARVKVWERVALILLTAVVLAGQALALLHADLLDRPSPFLWPVLVMGGLLVGSVLAKGFHLWIKGEHEQPEKGLKAILGMAGTVLGMGIVGVTLDLYRLSALLEKAPALAGTLSADWLVRDAALLSVAIILALAGGLAWFVLSQWVTLVTGARRELLALDPWFRAEEGE